MTLHDNWQYLLKKSWAIRWIALSGLLSGVEVILPIFSDTMPRNVFAGLSMLATVIAVVARVMAQPKDGL